MITVRFLSFIAKNVGLNRIFLDRDRLTTKEVLKIVSLKYPQIADLVDIENPEVSLILNGKSLYLPRDLDIEVVGELTISPIIAGG